MNRSQYARIAAVAVLTLLAACSETGIVEPDLFRPTDLSIAAAQTTGKIQICHRTNSINNPYVLLEVANSAADGISGKGEGQGDHYANPSHQGPIFDSEIHTHSSDDWGDIIPPMDGVHEGRNWTEEGQAIFNSGCDTTSQEPETGEIQVGVELSPAASGVEFTFAGALNTTLVSQGSTTPFFGQTVPAGTHVVTGPASAPGGYVLVGINCVEAIAPPPSFGDVGAATAVYSVEPGEVVQCVFQYFAIG